MINLKNEFCGRFNFVLRKADTEEIISESGFFDNVVLDQGLDAMASKSWFYYCKVGTGNSEPKKNQTKLDNCVAVSSTQQGSNYGASSTEPYYKYYQKTVRFAAGSLKNVSLSEVAIGYSSASDGSGIWNRALIRDNLGEPTTITVLSDEVLDVVCEVRVYFKHEDVISNLNLLDRSGNIVSTHTLTTRPAYITAGGAGFSSFGVYHGIYYAFTNGSVLGAITSAPNGSATASDITVSPYVPGTYKIDCTSIFTLNASNGNISAFSNYTNQSINVFCYQTGISPAIVKTAEQTLTITSTFSWGRYEGEVS